MGNEPRKAIPESTITAVLAKSKRRCCLCFHLRDDPSEKTGQIAHLDQDRTNAAEDNLAFLCQEHHDRFDSTTSQTKGLTVGEVKLAREKLIAFNQAKEAAAHQAAMPQSATAPQQPGLKLPDWYDDLARRQHEQSLEYNRQQDELAIESQRAFMRRVYGS